MTKRLLMGNEAMAHAALEAGVGVAAGYPGTPSSEIIETIARQYDRGAAHGVHVEWSTNEKAALELAFGASLAGVRSLFTCKQMGMNVASDALMSLNYVSVRGGLVLIVCDDPGPISSQTEQDTRRFATFAKVPVLDPSTPEQAFDMVKAAFDLSERYKTPVIVRPTTRVDHASAFFDIQEETQALSALDDGFQYDPSKWVIFPRRATEAHREINERLVAISEVFADELPYSAFNTMEEAGESFTGEPTFGILAGGISAAYAQEALRLVRERAQKANISLPRYRFMQVGTPYPFPERAIGAFTTGLADVLVLEELDSVLEDELAMFSGRVHGAFNIHGRHTGDVRAVGENDVDDIVASIERFLGLTGRLSLHRFRDTDGRGATSVHLSSRGEAELPDRPPVLCAGCPHRGTFYAVKQALGAEPAVLCGDIGCYTLGNAHPLDALDTCLCMGAGVTMAQGIAVADPMKKAIAYIGDSTFFASGETGISNAAYNNHDITVIVMDNSTTAMTGFQPHPGTGRTLMGWTSHPLSIEAVLKANGFAQIAHANPFDRDDAVTKVRQALDHEGPAAVIFEGACSQLIKPKDPVVINTEICTGCKRCITSIGCPAISFNNSLNGPRSRDRGQATIDTALCTGCGLCTQVCPFYAIHADSSLYRGSGLTSTSLRATDTKPGLIEDTASEPIHAQQKKHFEGQPFDDIREAEPGEDAMGLVSEGADEALDDETAEASSGASAEEEASEPEVQDPAPPSIRRGKHGRLSPLEQRESAAAASSNETAGGPEGTSEAPSPYEDAAPADPAILFSAQPTDGQWADDPWPTDAQMTEAQIESVVDVQVEVDVLTEVEVADEWVAPDETDDPMNDERSAPGWQPGLFDEDGGEL